MRNCFPKSVGSGAPVIVREVVGCKAEVAMDVLQQGVMEQSVLSHSNRDIAVRVGLTMPKIADDIPHDVLRAKGHCGLATLGEDLSSPRPGNRERAPGQESLMMMR